MKVSVIIPVYNVKQYLEQCLDSVLNQTFDDFEVICIDDSSTDGSGDMLDEYARKDLRIKVVHQENTGVAVVRNRGLEMAKGEYIFYLDSDDYLADNALEELYIKAKEQDADLCVCDGQDFDCETGRKLDRDYFNYAALDSIGDTFTVDDMGYRVFDLISYVCWIKMLKREYLLNNNITFELRKTFEDTMWSALAISMAGKITVVRKKLVFHRADRPDSLLNSVDFHVTDPVDTYTRTYEELLRRGLLNNDFRLKSFLNKTAANYYFTIRSFNDYDKLSEFWDLIHGEQTILYENGPYEENPELPDLNKLQPHVGKLEIW